MSKHLPVIFTSIVFVFLCSSITWTEISIASEIQNKQEQQAVFERAKLQILGNIGAVYGRDEKAIIQGTEALEGLLKQGRNDYEVYNLLYSAYQDMALRIFGEKPDKKQEYLDKAKKMILEMYALRPNDHDTQMLYADTLTDTNEIIAIFQKVISEDPDNILAHHGMLGSYGMQRDYDNQIIELKKLHDLSGKKGDFRNARLYMESLIDLLEGLNRKNEAIKLRAELNKKTEIWNQEYTEQEKAKREKIEKEWGEKQK